MQQAPVEERVLLETLKHICAEIIVANLTFIASVKDLLRPIRKLITGRAGS